MAHGPSGWRISCFLPFAVKVDLGHSSMYSLVCFFPFFCCFPGASLKGVVERSLRSCYPYWSWKLRRGRVLHNLPLQHFDCLLRFFFLRSGASLSVSTGCFLQHRCKYFRYSYAASQIIPILEWNQPLDFTGCSGCPGESSLGHVAEDQHSCSVHPSKRQSPGFS